MGKKSFSNIIYKQHGPEPSDFLLDLRQQIVRPAAPAIKRQRSFRPRLKIRLDWHWPKWPRRRLAWKLKFPKLAWPQKRRRIWHFGRPQTLRPILSLIVVFLLLILPFKLIVYLQDLRGMKARIVNASNDGLTDLKSAGQLLANRDFLSASQKFNQASDSFWQAQQDLRGVQSWLWQLALVVPTSQARLAASAPLITQAGDLSGQLGNDLTILAKNITTNLAAGDSLLLARQLKTDSEQALDRSLALNQIVDKINPASLPQGYRDQLVGWQDKLKLLSDSLSQFNYWSGASLDLLGDKMDRRYLLIFQNNAEARASGGFVGSYALLDISRGRIKNLEIPKGGSYDTNGNLRRFVNPPSPLRLVDVYWKFWDANWWPDWPTSARQLAWFLQESNGPTVDGVIAITPDIAEDLLRLTGPIDLSASHGLIITADNFRLTVQDNVESKVSGQQQPKKIIGDLTAAILEKLPAVLTDQHQAFELVKLLSQRVSARHILFYSNNPEIQSKWQQTGWSGQIEQLETGQDYLQVVNTNIAGGKTDLRIRQTIEQQVEIQADGSIINDVTIIREHTGEKREGLYGVRNVDWLRLYVPLGSQLLKADGFSQPDSHFFQTVDPTAEDLPAIKNGEGTAVIDSGSGTWSYQELNRTVFANWSMVDPGQTARLHFRYKLPYNLLDDNQSGWLAKVRSFLGLGRFGRYRLMIENQAGQSPATWKVTWHWPLSWKLLWSSPSAIDPDQWQSSQLVDRQTAGLLLQINN